MAALPWAIARAAGCRTSTNHRTGPWPPGPVRSTARERPALPALRCLARCPTRSRYGRPQDWGRRQLLQARGADGGPHAEFHMDVALAAASANEVAVFSERTCIPTLAPAPSQPAQRRRHRSCRARRTMPTAHAGIVATGVAAPTDGLPGRGACRACLSLAPSPHCGAEAARAHGACRGPNGALLTGAGVAPILTL